MISILLYTVSYIHDIKVNIRVLDYQCSAVRLIDVID